MNILYITTVFPKPQDSDTIYTDLACVLNAHGHSVSVIAVDSTQTKAGASPKQERGCEVLRVRAGALYNVGLFRKGLATISLGGKLKRAVKKTFCSRRFDLILYESPPLSTYKAVQFAKKQFGAKTFLMLKDIFPQNGVDLGLYRKNGLLYRYFRRQEKALYEISDLIGCMSSANISYLNQHNPEVSEKTVLFPNTKAIAEKPALSKKAIRQKYNLPEGKTIFLFGGNIGIPQDPENIVRCAKEICKQENGFFLAVGRGTHTETVRKALSCEKNARVMDNLPRNAFDELLFSCDVGLLFLDKRFTIPNYPSRILSYLNGSLPVVAVTDTASDMKDLIAEANCGFWCEAGDNVSFANCVTSLCNNEEKRLTFGKNGFSYFKEHLTVEKSAALLEQYTKTRKGE